MRLCYDWGILNIEVSEQTRFMFLNGTLPPRYVVERFIWCDVPITPVFPFVTYTEWGRA